MTLTQTARFEPGTITAIERANFLEWLEDYGIPLEKAEPSLDDFLRLVGVLPDEVPTAPADRFTRGDRVRNRRDWYGSVVADLGGMDVFIRWDDGTPIAAIPRSELELAEQVGVPELVVRLRQLRRDAGLSADEVATVDLTIEALGRALGDRSIRLRVAAEVERMVDETMNDPFESDIAAQPRVRQWFAAGGRWTLQRMRHRAEQLRTGQIERSSR